MKILMCLGFAFAMSSCVTISMPQSQQERETEGPSEENRYLEPQGKDKPKIYRPKASRAKQQGDKPAVRSLLVKAKRQLAQGNLELAQSFVERAYRIDHRSANVSFTMGKILYANDQYQQAEQWAMNAVSLYKKDQRSQKRRALELVSQCRLKVGDFNGANEAIDRANRL